MVCGRGHASWCCVPDLLWSASAEEEEEEQASRLNEGTTGGPSSEEIATQVSLSSITAWRGELTVFFAKAW